MDAWHLRGNCELNGAPPHEHLLISWSDFEPAKTHAAEQLFLEDLRRQHARGVLSLLAVTFTERLRMKACDLRIKTTAQRLSRSRDHTLDGGPRGAAMETEDCEWKRDSPIEINLPQIGCDITSISNRSTNDSDNSDWQTMQCSESCSVGARSVGAVSVE